MTTVQAQVSPMLPAINAFEEMFQENKQFSVAKIVATTTLASTQVAENFFQIVWYVLTSLPI